MKKEDIEKGIDLFIKSLKNSKLKIKYEEDIGYMRSLDGKYLGPSNKDCNILGYVLITEDPEKLALLDKMVYKAVEKNNFTFEDFGEVS